MAELKNDECFIRRRNYGNFIFIPLPSLSFSSYFSSTFCHIRLYYNEFINNKFLFFFLPISSLFVIMYTY